MTTLLQVRGLRVVLETGGDVVAGIDFDVAVGEIVGLVGESGSGKTTIASALLGHARAGARIAGGAVELEGVNLLGLSPTALRAVRGKQVGHVAQDPAMALNPMLRIGDQLDELLRVHEPELGKGERLARIAAVIADVGLPDTSAFLRRFVHELSGGQQQRVLLALAFVLRPRLIVLDEPTTALDVTTQAKVLSTVRRLCHAHSVGAVYVSHDLAVVRELVDRVVVLYAGRIAEVADRDRVFERPLHPYSRGLLSAVPDPDVRRTLRAIAGHAPAPDARPAGCAFAPRCDQADTRCATVPPLAQVGPGHALACFHPVHGVLALAADPTALLTDDPVAPPLLAARWVDAYHGADQVLHGVNLDLPTGRCTALVGESGSGKTTLARTLVGLGPSVAGDLSYNGEPMPIAGSARDAGVRRNIQYVFQNPYRALNPRQSVREILCTALRHFFPIGRAEAEVRAVAALARVTLSADVLDKRPGALSGGERQRVAICRALVCEPRLLICDEITSALDVSVQAAILELLRSLQREGLTILFVTHDLAVVRAIADRVVVLRGGRVVEAGPVDEVLDRSEQSYTRRLMADSPRANCVPEFDRQPAEVAEFNHRVRDSADI